MSVPGWMSSGACVGMDPDIFFPDNGDTSRAEVFCAQCEVRSECLQLALSLPEFYDRGVMGGTSERQRRRMRRRLARAS